MNAKMASLKAQMNALTTSDVQVARYGGGNIKGFQQLINDTGQYRIQSIKAKSAVESYTQALQKQDVVFRGWRKNAQLRNQVLKEQYRLQNMAVMGWKEDAMGRMSADMIIPRDAPERLGSFRRSLADVRAGTVSFGDVLGEQRMRIGLWSQSVKSASHNLVNWGKNTQWAGRQMMVGLSLPFAALAAGTGALAYQIDKEMTRILKVYDYATTNMEAEGERVKEASFGTARSMARTYGQAAADTINILGELAATGKTGVELQKSAEVVSRASFLGELDRQDAIKTTITLQTVYKQNTDQLAESFAYLNALENATSLSMRDMTVAIPKLAGVVNSLGGDVTDIGTLMTAAKAGGLEAAEGANALKTVLFRSVVPYGKGAETFLAKTKIDLKGLVESTNGEAIPTLIKMGEAMKDLGQIERTAVLKDVFGIYQGSKAGIMIEQMLQLGDATTQVGRAAGVAQAGMSSWAETQDREIAMMQRSASGQFKIALESIKVELAEVGEPFLEVATWIIKAVTGIVSKFNELGDGTKKFVLLTLAVGAIFGPIVMLAGVFANLIGTLIRTGATALMMVSRFKAVDAQQHAAALLAKQSTLAFSSQATAAQLLSHQLGIVTQNLKFMAQANHDAKLAGTPLETARRTAGGNVSVVDATTGKRRRARAAETRAFDAHEEQTRLIQGAEQLEETTGRTRRNYVGMAAGIGTAVTMSSMLFGVTNQWVNSLGVALMMMPLLVQGIAAMGGARAAGWVLGRFRAMNTAISGGRAGGLLGGIRSAAGGLAALGPAMGPLGIALLAAGAGFAFFYNKLKKAKEEMRALVAAGDSLTEVVGGTPLKAGEYIDSEGAVKQSLMARTEAFEKSNKSAVEGLRKLGAEAKKTGDSLALENELKRIGLDVYQATKDAKMARDAVQVALNAAGNPSISIDVLDFKFESASWIAGAREKIDNALIDAVNDNDKKWYDPGMSNDIEERLKGEAERIAKAFGEAQAGIMSPQDFKKITDEYGDRWANAATEIVARMSDNFGKEENNILKKFNIDPTDNEAIARALITNRKLVDELNRVDELGLDGRKLADASNELSNLRDGYVYVSKAVAEKTHTQNVDGVATRNLTTVHKALADITPETAGGIKDVGAAAEATAGQVDQLTGEMRTAEDVAKEYMDAHKGAMSSAMNMVFEEAASQVDGAHESYVDSLERDAEESAQRIEDGAQRRQDDIERRGKALDARHKAEDKTFTNAWKDRAKAIEASFDGRIKKIQDVMDAEQKAEEARQRAFEAEKTRIQRLAEMYNQNIDFNVALNTGELDEAAKLANNMRAAQEQWGIDDALAESGTAAEQRREGQQAQIDAIESAKEARMNKLQEEEQAAKDALQARQQREKQALEDEKERDRQSVESAKKAAKARSDADIKAANDSHAARKKALDMELAALKAFTPKNEAELQAHIGRIEKAYGDHGYKLNTKSAEWSTYVARAMKSATDTAAVELSENVRWKAIGAEIGKELGNNILGMSFADFVRWMETGELPPAPKPPPKPSATAGTPTGYTGNRDHQAPGVPKATPRFVAPGYHGGGPIKHDRGSGRAGRPLSAGLFSDEVPIIAQKGEFMMQRKAVEAIGMDNLKAMNSGNAGPDKTGRMHQGGLVKGLGGMVQALWQRGMAKALIVGAARKAGDIMNGTSPGQIPPGVMNMMMNGATVGGQGQYGGSPVKFTAPGLPPIMEGFPGLPPGTLPAAPPGEDGFASWLTATQRMVNPNVMQKVWQGLSMVPGQQLITSGYRPGSIVAGSNRLSLHASGRAVDIGALARKDGGSAASEATGDMIANIFRTQIPGVSEVLWKTMRGGNHFDHVHVGFRHGGGEIGSSMTKGLKNGGITLNDGYAKLHRKEAVLTAPLTEQLHRGIQNLDGGGNVTYDIKVDLTGAVIREDVDIERAIKKVLREADNKTGKKRTIN